MEFSQTVSRTFTYLARNSVPIFAVTIYHSLGLLPDLIRLKTHQFHLVPFGLLHGSWTRVADLVGTGDYLFSLLLLFVLFWLRVLD